MAVTHLAAGRDVIMPQFLDANDEIEGFRAVAEETGSGFREIVHHGHQGAFRRTVRGPWSGG